MAKVIDWCKQRMEKIRALIKAADPKITEEQKYKKPTNPAGIPVWYREGMICTGETYKEHLRLTFFKGSKLKDSKGVLNKHTALVLKEDDKLNESAFKALIREAVAFNLEKKESKAKR